MAQQPERTAIGPVQIVRIKQQALWTGEIHKNSNDRIEKEQALFMWRQFHALGKRTKPSLNFGSKFRDLLRGIAKLCAQRRVVLFFADQTTKGFNERKIGSRCFVFIATA